MGAGDKRICSCERRNEYETLKHFRFASDTLSLKDTFCNVPTIPFEKSRDVFFSTGIKKVPEIVSVVFPISIRHPSPPSSRLSLHFGGKQPPSALKDDFHYDRNCRAKF